jgi:hypothetical protein
MAAARSFFPPLAVFNASILAAVFFRSPLGTGFLRGFLVADTGLEFISALAAEGRALLPFALGVDFIVSQLLLPLIKVSDELRLSFSRTTKLHNCVSM